MDRSDTHRRISILCRRRHGNALYAIGWLTGVESTETLEQLLEGLEEFERVNRAELPLSNHLAAFQERFGRKPGN